MPNYSYKNLSLPLSLSNWERLNENFNQVARDLGGISGAVLDEVVENAKLEYLSPVANFSALETTYPNADNGKVAQTLNDNKFYRKEDGYWVFLQQFGSGPFDDVYNKLADQKYYANIKEFGAIGDGSSDDTSAIQAAINQAVTSKKHVYFPKGTYNISSRIVLPSNSAIEGNGAVIKLVDNALKANNPDIFLIKDVSNVTIVNLEIDGNNSNQTQLDTNVYRGILIQNAENVTINNCRFHDIQHPAIQVSGSIPQNYTTKGAYNLVVSNCTFKNVWCSLQITESDSRYIYFHSNDVENTWEHGFTTYPGVSFVEVKGNIFKNVGLRMAPSFSTFIAGCGIRIFETINAIVEGNIIINPHFCGIRLTTNSPQTYQATEYAVVANNIVRGGLRSGSIGSGILIGEQGKSNNVVVSNNIVENFTSYSFAEGIKVIGDFCVVQGNRIKDIKQSGVVISGNYNVISENSITDSGLYGLVFGGTVASDNCVATGNNIQTINQANPISRGIYAQSNATNVRLSNNNLVGVVNNYFNASSYPLFINNAYSTTAAPSVGSYMRGERAIKSDPSVGAPKAWTCTASGTMGTLNGGTTTGSINTGTTILAVSSATGLLPGQYISISGVSGTKRIMKISGMNVTLDASADATVTNAAISFSNATFVSEGSL